jgi:hypothetical protein
MLLTPLHLLHQYFIVSQHQRSKRGKISWAHPRNESGESGVEDMDTTSETDLGTKETLDSSLRFGLVGFHSTSPAFYGFSDQAKAPSRS